MKQDSVTLLRCDPRLEPPGAKRLPQAFGKLPEARGVLLPMNQQHRGRLPPHGSFQIDAGGCSGWTVAQGRVHDPRETSPTTLVAANGSRCGSTRNNGIARSSPSTGPLLHRKPAQPSARGAPQDLLVRLAFSPSPWCPSACPAVLGQAVGTTFGCAPPAKPPGQGQPRRRATDREHRAEVYGENRSSESLS